MDKLKEEREHILNELRASGAAIPNKIIINIRGCETTCYINLDKALEEERKIRLDEEYKMKILTLGYAAFSLGAGIVGCICMNLLAGKHQINSSQNRIASLCGAGLIVGGGLLIMNSFFESQKKARC